ncbi:hypothetical protein BX616_008419 [Lobosporangium transversale]|uniref:Membrane transport protein-domain-containing protein n=1 Tax=Lobosporangium transversale TaxID=64571 RepID=A0A1Y2GNK0_9FUNG|nr:membrane transport protein-domain-containing protein [Lobosporangium transversale]KAF9914384.1 hypothetical protein BX616_008419 [Lobosporangium transversale]ORZ14937.1 membrane transport protein-domain-containing protein [Lobosporangium transversale]|eukprot:XP_021881069.1 membrane transport protein-domain-containing protein [Lobosporangium transversale]
MDWIVLTTAAGEAVSQVLIVVACGVILSRNGYLSQPAQKAISKVNLYFMTPCLMFTKIASTISWTQFKAYWPIPVFYCLFSSISWLVAKIGSRLLGFSKDEEKFVIASVLFSNTNSLPMALMQSLAFSAAGEHLLRDENDTKADVAARGISYILFYAIFGNLVRWSYGFSLLVPRDKTKEEETDYNEQLPPSVVINVDPSTSRRTDATASTLHPSYNGAGPDDPAATPTLQTFKPAPINTSYLHPTYANSSAPSPALSVKSATKSVLMRATSTVNERLRQVLTPPLTTALIALFIGLVPALHHLFMSPQSVVYRFLIRPIESCGDAAIPMILLCLGAQVVHFASSSSSPSPSPSSSSSSSNDNITTNILSSSEAVAPKQSKSRGKAPQGSSPPPQTGLGIYASTSQDDSSSDEERNPALLSVHKTYNTTPTSKQAPYGNGIATAQSNASSSATLLHFHQPSDQGRPSFRSTAISDDSDNEDADEALPLLKSSPTQSSPSPRFQDTVAIKASGASNYRIPWIKPIPFVLFARMIVVPVLCLPAVIFHPDHLSPILTMDPTFSLALVLLVAAPTAINTIQMCQIKGFFEMEMASVLFWSYCIFGIPCILGWSLVGLWVAERE